MEKYDILRLFFKGSECDKVIESLRKNKKPKTKNARLKDRYYNNIALCNMLGVSKEKWDKMVDDGLDPERVLNEG